MTPIVAAYTESGLAMPSLAPDNYEILEELGEGAFARVFRAREKRSGQLAALKILKEGFAGDAEVIERFRREVFAVASIDSPHVVKLHDFGMSGAEVFIAMEYLQGPTLRELLRGRPWSAKSARVIVGQVAEALAAAHAQGIVHRDLKPENVMLVPGAYGRQVKVLDFGLAKLVTIERKLELEPLTRAGMCFGTPQYMAPEQMQGRAASQSADLFALAVIAYEMLSGRLPWDGGDPRDVFRAVLGSPPPPLGDLHASVAPQRAALDRFLGEALAKTPETRPADAGAFFSAFEAALFGQARRAGPIFCGDHRRRAAAVRRRAEPGVDRSVAAGAAGPVAGGRQLRSAACNDSRPPARRRAAVALDVEREPLDVAAAQPWRRRRSAAARGAPGGAQERQRERRDFAGERGGARGGHQTLGDRAGDAPARARAAALAGADGAVPDCRCGAGRLLRRPRTALSWRSMLMRS